MLRVLALAALGNVAQGTGWTTRSTRRSARTSTCSKQRFISRGMDPARPSTAARRQFGGVTRAKQDLREGRVLPSIDVLVQDIRHACRQLRRSRRFTASAALTLALGIGAATAVFAVIDTVTRGRFCTLNRTGSWRRSNRPARRADGAAVLSEFPRFPPGEPCIRTPGLLSRRGLHAHRCSTGDRGPGRDRVLGSVSAVGDPTGTRARFPAGRGTARHPRGGDQPRLVVEPLRRRPAHSREGNPHQRDVIYGARRRPAGLRVSG